METGITISARSLQFYAVTKKWASDLEFFEIEVAFFHHLIKNHFTHLLEPKHLAETRAVSERLFWFETEIAHIERALGQHLKQVELMAEDIVPEDAATLAVTQVKLEHMIATLTQEFRDTKKALFKLLEDVLRENKPVAVS